MTRAEAMRPVSTADVEWFTPTRYQGEVAARSYLLGPLNYRERATIDQETMARCGRGATEEEVREEVRNGIAAAFFTEAERSKAHATLDAYTETLEAWREAERLVPAGATNGMVPKETQEARAAFLAALGPAQRLEAVVSRAHTPLSQLLSINYARISEIAFLFVVKGVRDWRHVGRVVDGVWQAAPCSRERERLTDAALCLIPDEDLQEIAARVRELSTLTEADRGNFASPSGVSVTPAPPTAD